MTGLRTAILNALLFFPSREVPKPSGFGRPFEDVAFGTADGERLHGWWLPASSPAIGHLLYCHGNGGNIADRTAHARALCSAGFDVLLFDYRGYGRSTGTPTEAGTYEDARAARTALLGMRGVDPMRLVYLGESLGAAVALFLALESPPAGVVLHSAFTSVRDMAAVHYPLAPRRLVPDAYPSLRLIPRVRAPVLVLHGGRDAITPPSHGQALFDAAPEPKRIHVFPQAGHNDLLVVAGRQWIETLTRWAGDVLPSDDPGPGPDASAPILKPR